MGFVNQTYLQISLRPETKEFIKNRAEELGYKTISAFLVSSAKNHIKIQIDTSKYDAIAKEINLIGRNINHFVRRIHSDGIYSDTDIELLLSKQQMIIDLMRKEYNQILKFNRKYTLDAITLSEKKKFEKLLIEQHIPVPKKLLLEEMYEMIREDFSYLSQTILDSPLKDDGLDRYLYRYLESGIITSFDEETLVKFADELFNYTQKMKFKMVDFDYAYNDDDWYELKDLLDEYGVASDLCGFTTLRFPNIALGTILKGH